MNEVTSGRLRVFVGSTMEELRDLRAVLESRLSVRGVNAWLYETSARPVPEATRYHSLEEVAASDVFVGVFWKQFGEVTSEEYRFARKNGKPCFVYIRGRSIEREPALSDFLGREVTHLSEGVGYHYFEHAVEFAERVADDILAWLVKSYRELTAQINEHQNSRFEEHRLRTRASLLQASTTTALPEGQPVDNLVRQMNSWFQTLGYRHEAYEARVDDSIEQILNVPNRRGYDRIVVRAVEGEALLSDLEKLQGTVEQEHCDEGWLVAHRRISQAVRDQAGKGRYKSILCYTFDELLDESADFTGYLNWLEMEIKRLGIEHEYETLACRKEEMDPVSGKTATSRYAESNRGIDGYIDRWLDDPSKEHISVLGEFGTGKTWFCLHYAAGALARYREAKERGTQRPRLPLVIPLRDYAKAVSVESLLSEFFFRKFEIPLPGYSAFEALNRMGKLLLIFDGFDEMAARVDRQKMIDNFWELARVVVPGGKAVLTCRTEHFPEAMAGRELLGAELPGSTTNLVVEPPQFEVVELETFSDEQIRRVLRRRANEPTVNRIMSNPHLRDLARRPVMTSFVIDALPDVDAGKPIDLSRIYLYAVQRKMNRDIRAERTFTSLADKLYFLCEVSVEMLRTHAMALNYRSFPDRIRQLFGGAALEQKDLDHWHYDMMGQTMMIRNADGDYAPAHRSLVEFFASYQYAAELGGLADDFLELCRSQSNIDNRLAPRDYTWSKYFQRERDSAGRPVQIAPLRRFLPEPAEENAMSIGAAPIGSAMAELLENIVDRAALVDVIARTATIQVPLFLGGNAATVANRISRDWSGFTLLGGSLRGGNMDNANLCNAKLTGSDLRDCSIRAARLDGADLSGCDLRGAQLWHCSAEAASFHDCVVDSNRVLVFVGKRAELMVRGSTLLDAAFRLHTHVGYQCAGGTIDGVEAPLDQQLHHGCQVWIRKSAQGDVLDPAWMNFAVTTTARAGINRYFAHLDDRVERAMESMLSGMTLSARVREEIIQFGPLRAALKSRMFPNPRTEPGKAESLLASPAGLAAAERRGVALLDRFEALRLALVEAGVTTSPPRTSVRLANIFHYARFLSSTGYETGAATVDAVLDDTLSATAAAQGLLRCREEGGLAAWMSGRNES